MASLCKPSMSSSRRVPCLWITVTEWRLKKSLVSKISEHCQHAKTFEWKRVIVACCGKRGSRAFYSATRYTCLLISLTSFWQLFDNFLVASFSTGQSKWHTRGNRSWQLLESKQWDVTSPSLKLLHFSLVTSNRRLQKVVKKSSELNNFFKGSH